METPDTSQYDRIEPIGQGAMGHILLAKDKELKRHVAIKTIHSKLMNDPRILGRFLREAQITAQLDHPNIVPVYQFEVSEGELSYAMKLIYGKTLKKYIKESSEFIQKDEKVPATHDLNQLLSYFLAVCDALDFSHNKGVIHRDLKPENIMIGPYNEVYLMDWGIARVMGNRLMKEEESELKGGDWAEDMGMEHTQAGQVLGTPRFMSPEQAAGRNDELDGRSDQFSLGLILFELLTLKPAFKAKTAVEMLTKILKVELEPLVHLSPETPLPRELNGIILKATAKNPDDRYASVAALAQDVRFFMRGDAVSAAPDNFWQKLGRWFNQNKSKAFLSMMGLVLGTVTLVIISLLFLKFTTESAHQKESKLNAYLSAATDQGQKINRHFVKMEILLRGLSAKTIRRIESGEPSKDPVYFPDPFLTPGQVDSTLFGGKISIHWPTTALAPGVKRQDLKGKLSKILPLRDDFVEMVLKSQPGLPHDLPENKIQNWVGTQGLPIMWAHVSLKEGAIYMFPGVGFTTPNYDPRTRGFYLLSAKKYGVFWGVPYFDKLSGALLPVTTSMYSHTGEFLGVAGIDLRVFYVIEHLLKLKAYPQLEEAYLVDANGKIIVRSSDISRTGVNSKSKEDFKSPLFPEKSIKKQILSKDFGGLVEANKKVYSYTRLNSLGWYYVTQSKSEDLL